MTEAELRTWVERLASIERPSASEGERQAAELIAADLESTGARVRLEEERAHGGYWWPIGLPAALSALAGPLGAVVGLGGAAAVADDIVAGQQRFRRHLLPSRPTENVVAEIGPEEAERTVVGLLEHANTTPPTMWGAVIGPALVGLGSLFGMRRLRRAGQVLCLGYAAAMADIGLRKLVPGANDNLSGVAVLSSLARSLAADPPPEGLRVILLSTGSEESFLEGMHAFSRRHFGDLPKDTTRFISVDTVGSPRLAPLEGEGMLWMNEYPKDFLALLKEEAERLGVDLVPNLRFRNATDGVVPLRRGYPAVALGSVDEFKIPTNYHWPTDTADRVDYGTVADCARLCDALVRRL